MASNGNRSRWSLNGILITKKRPVIKQSLIALPFYAIKGAARMPLNATLTCRQKNKQLRNGTACLKATCDRRLLALAYI